MKKRWKKIEGWGAYPAIKAEVYAPLSIIEVQQIVHETTPVLARGSGYSYGDSSLNQTVISTRNLTRILKERENWIEVEAGITLEKLLDYLIAQRRFLGVTPGTRAITIGGAIASDVHGKNHHKAGSFFNITESLVLVNENGAIIKCNRQENAAVFYSCFGGMGLQGIIVSAVILTIPLPSLFIKERQFTARSLPEMFQLMQQHQDAPYLVGWIDLLGKNLSGIVKTGEWNLAVSTVAPHPKKVVTIPFRMPVAPPRFLFRWYNKRYLAKAQKYLLHSIPINEFFYPLDSIRNWRYLFGRKGLLQYHFQLPPAVSETGITAVIEMIRSSKAVCTLAVLKRFGKSNEETPESFARAGFNLALDFIHTKKAVALIQELDKKISALGGRIYKAKDALSSLPSSLKSSKFQSIQNRRYEHP